MTKSISLIASLLLCVSASLASAADADTLVVTVVNVQADNPNAYVDLVSKNPQVFSSLGAQAGGTCMTLSGHRYPGQAFAWSIFENASAAFKGAQQFATRPRSEELNALSRVISTEFYAILKPFTLPSGFERRYQIVVNDVAGYIAAATALEKVMQENGHKVEVGIFAPLGNGHQKANMLDVRIFAVTPEVAGMMVNDFLQQAPWAMEPYANMLATVESLELDTFESCAQHYTAD